MRYVALVGDIVKSRSIPQRRRFEARLAECLAMINARYAGMVVAPVRPVLGVDTISGVLKAGVPVLDLAVDMLLELRGERIRLAFGLGRIDVGLGTGDASRADGPAFHRAAAALEQLEARGGLIALTGYGARIDPILNAGAGLASLVLENWTERQMEVIQGYRMLGRQAAVAEKLGISQQAVSDSLKKSHYERLLMALEPLNAAMEVSGDGE